MVEHTNIRRGGGPIEWSVIGDWSCIDVTYSDEHTAVRDTFFALFGLWTNHETDRH